MKTITKDYVSFEVAKLLKEKGFDEPFFFFYRTDDKVKKIHHACIPKSYQLKYTDDEIVNAPTYQRAMRWLREVHHLYINVGFGNDYKGEFLYMGDIYDLTKDAIYAKYKPIIEADDYLFDNPKSYEEAVEAGIKYCLENLI